MNRTFYSCQRSVWKVFASLCRGQLRARAAGHQHGLHLWTLHLRGHPAGEQRVSAAVPRWSRAHPVHQQVRVCDKAMQQHHQNRTVCFWFYWSKINVPFAQPSENVGLEQHTWESREPLVQLLQALHARLHERTLQRTWEQRRGLSLSAPQSACFKMTIRPFLELSIIVMDYSLFHLMQSW